MAELGVPNRVPHIPMAQEILNEPGIWPCVCQHVPGAVAQHVRANLKTDAAS
jgi:hypothetical protein